MKNLDSTFSQNGIAITIIFEDLRNTVSLGSNPISAKTYGFKDDNIKVKYQGVRYIVKKEEIGEYTNSVTLYLDTTV